MVYLSTVRKVLSFSFCKQPFLQDKHRGSMGGNDSTAEKIMPKLNTDHISSWYSDFQLLQS